MRVTELCCSISIFTLLGTCIWGLGQSSKLFPVFSPICEYRERDFILISKALSYGLNFFKHNVEQLILDAAVGTRIVERQIGRILRLHPKISTKARVYLERLQENAREISERIATPLEETARDEPYNNTIPWITSDKLWKSPLVGGWRNLNLERNWRNDLTFESLAQENEVLSENISDTCIGHLFEDCEVSAQCQKMFLSGAHSKYSLTHQIIFLHVAKEMSCIRDLGFNTKDWRAYSKTLCSRVYQEAKAIESEGFPTKYRDLFAEQVVVCGLSGYREFLDPKWTYEILFWQQHLKPRLACFPEHGYDDNLSASKSLQRRKRSDTVIEFEDTKCSIHFSAVGIGALALSLRYFLETCVLGAAEMDSKF